MPLKVLAQHEVLTYDTKARTASLSCPRFTLEQKAAIRALCEQKLGQYLSRRGMSIWDYRLIDDTTVPHDVRYQVLAESDRRCALCGATEKERPLDVDHILPRSRQGKNDKANLQVLCSRCNRAKGNRDTRDFRPGISPSAPGCVFCGDEIATRVIEETELMRAVDDLYPVSDGHALIIPRRHIVETLGLTERERQDANALIRVIANTLRSRDPRIEGFNIGENIGATAGQTVMHAHIHLIPRRNGDVADPFGGVRAIIPERARYP